MEVSGVVGAGALVEAKAQLGAEYIGEERDGLIAVGEGDVVYVVGAGGCLVRCCGLLRCCFGLGIELKEAFADVS